MTSEAGATLTLRGFSAAKPPAAAAAVETTLRKRFGDGLVALTFTDATLRDPRTGAGARLVLEKPLSTGGDGPALKARLQYDAGPRAASGSLTLLKRLGAGADGGPSDVELKCTYAAKGDVFTLEETWRLDGANKVAGSYNFSTEEATFSYSHTSGAYTATAGYNFAREAPSLALARRAGKATATATYAPRDGAATLAYAAKPFRAVLRGAVGAGRGARVDSAALTLTHEFEL